MQRSWGPLAYRGVTGLTHTEMVQGIGRNTADTAAFEAFFEREYPRLVRLLMPTTGDLPAAEEAVQEAMARVFERWDRVGKLDSPPGYAYVTAVNAHRRRFRRLWTALPREMPDPQPGPAAQVGARDELARAVRRLSQAERDALLLVSILGLSAQEAANLLKIRPVSVRSRLHRARAALTEMEGDRHG